MISPSSACSRYEPTTTVLVANTSRLAFLPPIFSVCRSAIATKPSPSPWKVSASSVEVVNMERPKIALKAASASSTRKPPSTALGIRLRRRNGI